MLFLNIPQKQSNADIWNGGHATMNKEFEILLRPELSIP